MRNIVSKDSLKVISDEVRYFRDLQGDYPAAENADSRVSGVEIPNRSESTGYRWLIHILSAILLIAGLLAFITALTYVNADSIAQRYPATAASLDLLRGQVDAMMELLKDLARHIDFAGDRQS